MKYDTISKSDLQFLLEIFRALEAGEFYHAEQHSKELLDMDPENAYAHLAKLMSERKVRAEHELSYQQTPLEESRNYKWILRFADDELKQRIEAYNQCTINKKHGEQGYYPQRVSNEISSIFFASEQKPVSIEKVPAVKSTVEQFNKRQVAVFFIVGLLIFTAAIMLFNDSKKQTAIPENKKQTASTSQESVALALKPIEGELTSEDFSFYFYDEKMESTSESPNFIEACIMIESYTNAKYTTRRGITIKDSEADVLSAYIGLDYEEKKERDFEGNRPSKRIIYQNAQGKIIFDFNKDYTTKEEYVRKITIKPVSIVSVEKKIKESHKAIRDADVGKYAINIDISESDISINDLPSTALSIINNVNDIDGADNTNYYLLINLLNTSDELIRRCRWPLGTGDASRYTIYHYNSVGLVSSTYSFADGSIIK